MNTLLTILTIAVAAVILVLLIAYICYRLVFYSANRTSEPGEAYDIPTGKVYAPFREELEGWVREARALPCTKIQIKSFDGLTLRGSFYEYAPGAPIELMFHGYRGTAERDLSGGIHRCFRLGHSALVIHQRASVGSEGHVISFGINEHRDCLAWLDYVQQHFAPETKIILTGISMGASTVLLAADKSLPPNVIGILADCGFTGAKDIIQKVIRQLHLPVVLLYPFIKLGARLYGRFDLEETAPLEVLKSAHVPIIFFHGEADDFVPCEMSRRNFEACASEKMLVTVPGAGHGLSYSVAPEKYLQAMRDFFDHRI